jgi:hypothetical protein
MIMTACIANYELIRLCGVRMHILRLDRTCKNQNRQKGVCYRLYGLVSFQAAALRIREVPFYHYTW